MKYFFLVIFGTIGAFAWHHTGLSVWRWEYFVLTVVFYTAGAIA